MGTIPRPPNPLDVCSFLHYTCKHQCLFLVFVPKKSQEIWNPPQSPALPMVVHEESRDVSAVCHLLSMNSHPRLLPLIPCTFRDPTRGCFTKFTFPYGRTNPSLAGGLFLLHFPLENSCYLPDYPEAELNKNWEWNPRNTGHFCAFPAQAEHNKPSN